MSDYPIDTSLTKLTGYVMLLHRCSDKSGPPWMATFASTALCIPRACVCEVSLVVDQPLRAKALAGEKTVHAWIKGLGADVPCPPDAEPFDYSVELGALVDMQGRPVTLPHKVAWFGEDGVARAVLAR